MRVGGDLWGGVFGGGICTGDYYFTACIMQGMQEVNNCFFPSDVNFICIMRVNCKVCKHCLKYKTHTVQ